MSSDEKMQVILNRFDEVLNEQFKGWGTEEGYWEARTLYVTIEGDWKHAHLRFKCLLEETLKEFNCTIQSMTEREIGDSQCDWYTAEHRYVFDLKNFKMKEAA